MGIFDFLKRKKNCIECGSIVEDQKELFGEVCSSCYTKLKEDGFLMGVPSENESAAKSEKLKN